ncbi:MAG: PL29 family lyase N-terminal domain-containing protein [Alistipes sp.]
MKQLFLRMMMLIAVSMTVVSCSYDDDALWNEIGNIKTELASLNQEVTSLQTLVDALNKGTTISKVEQTATGYTITFSDGKIITIKNGQNGADAPVIGIKLFEGIYYWTLTTNGTTDWLMDGGHKIPVSGVDGATPKMAVDAEGYWTIDGTRITDVNGHEVKATGTNGTNGDSFFHAVTDNGDTVTFVLTDGTTFTLPKNSATSFGFTLPENGKPYFVFDFGAKKTLTIKMNDISNAEIMTAPKGWNCTLNVAKKSLTVKAPAASEAAYAGGIITLVGIDKNGQTVFASADVCASVDYTDPAGSFVICEGNMTSVNGMLVYYDKTGKEYQEVFEQANDGLEIGNVIQDMFMANGKVYLLTQNGDNLGGAGRFVVCDGRTMRMEYADPLIVKTPENKATWPQHIVVVSATKAYLQYSDSNMETTSGICALTLGEKSVQAAATVEGTFGKFTSVGAIKTRMVYSRGKVYAGCGHSVVIINPANDNAVEKKIPFEGRQVKGIVKGADGSIYFALAGTFTGTIYAPKFTAQPKIVGIDHTGTILQETEMPAGIKLPVASWSPAIGMCASFTDPYLYFVDTDAFNAGTATRYNYETKTFDKGFVSGSETIYGVMGQHPTTKKLWVGRSSYVDSNIYIYDVTGASATEEKHFAYPTQKGASPAGIDFAYRFSQEYINR